MATLGCGCTTEAGQSGSPELCPNTSFQTEEGSICEGFRLAGTGGELVLLLVVLCVLFREWFVEPKFQLVSNVQAG